MVFESKTDAGVGMEGDFNFASLRLQRSHQHGRAEQASKRRKEEEAKEEAIKRNNEMLEVAREERSSFVGPTKSVQKEEPTTAWADNNRPFTGDFKTVHWATYEQPDTGPSGSIHKAYYEGDKVCLPPQVLETLVGSSFSSDSSMNSFSIVNPLLFRFYCASTGRVTHGGVLEFTATPEGVVVPLKIRKSLGLPNSEGENIHVTTVQLPKGTYVKLKNKQGFLSDIPDIKCFLESWLRKNCCALTVGDEFLIGGRQSFLVERLEPSEAVSIIDTEISVDICNDGMQTTSPTSTEPVSADVVLPPRESTLSASIPLSLFTPTTGFISTGDLHNYRLLIGNEIRSSLEDNASSILIQLENSPTDGCDLYVSLPPLLEASSHVHHFEDISSGTKRILVNHERVLEAYSSHQSRHCPYIFETPTVHPGPTWPTTIYMGLTGCTSNVEYTLSAVIKGPENSCDDTQRPIGHETTVHQNARVCGNCKQTVGENYDLHVLHCNRNYAVCNICNVVLRKAELGSHWHCPKCTAAMHKGEMKKHEATWHTEILCECGRPVERFQLKLHRSHSCPRRLILCIYCGDYVEADDEAGLSHRDRLHGLTAHEAACGSRTTECTICQKRVLLKEMELHMAAVHKTPEQGTLEPCPYCGKADLDESTWTTHIDSHWNS